MGFWREKCMSLGTIFVNITANWEQIQQAPSPHIYNLYAIFFKNGHTKTCESDMENLMGYQTGINDKGKSSSTHNCFHTRSVESNIVGGNCKYLNSHKCKSWGNGQYDHNWLQMLIHNFSEALKRISIQFKNWDLSHKLIYAYYKVRNFQKHVLTSVILRYGVLKKNASHRDRLINISANCEQIQHAPSLEISNLCMQCFEKTDEPKHMEKMCLAKPLSLTAFACALSMKCCLKCWTQPLRPQLSLLKHVIFTPPQPKYICPRNVLRPGPYCLSEVDLERSHQAEPLPGTLSRGVPDTAEVETRTRSMTVVKPSYNRQQQRKYILFFVTAANKWVCKYM